MQGPWAQARGLGEGVAPRTLAIPRDRLLRGKNARQVTKRVLRALQRFERPRPVKLPAVHFLTSVKAMKAAQQALVKAGAHPRVAQAALGRRHANAVYLAQNVLLYPPLIRRLESSDLLLRLRGVRTLAHEWSHHLSEGLERFIPLEEGLAERFADRFLGQQFGVRPGFLGADVYPQFCRIHDEVARLVGGALALEALLRRPPSQVGTLRSILLGCGADAAEASWALGYNARGDEDVAPLLAWLGRLGRGHGDG